MPQAMNIPKLALTTEDLLGPFTGKIQTSRKSSKELDDLGYVVVVFPVLGAGLRMEKVVACDEVEDLVRSIQVR